MLEYVATASFNRTKVVIMPKPGPEETSLNTSYLILFILNDNNESYVDVLRSKFSDLFAMLRDLEMAIPTLSSSNSIADSTATSKSSVAGTAMHYDKSNKYGSNQSQVSARSALTGSTKSTSRNTTPASFNLSKLSSISEDNGGGELDSTYNYQMALYKIRKMMESRLKNLADLLDFVDFLTESYLPFISLNISAKVDRISRNVEEGKNDTVLSQSQIQSLQRNVLYTINDEESREFLVYLKECNFAHFQVRHQLLLKFLILKMNFIAFFELT